MRKSRRCMSQTTMTPSADEKKRHHNVNRELVATEAVINCQHAAEQEPDRLEHEQTKKVY